MAEHTRQRWSDHELEAFHNEFSAHKEDEKVRHEKQSELYEAVFRQESRELGRPPGLLQLVSRMSDDLNDIKIANDRQKRFVGGMVFAFTSIAFFLTDTFKAILDILRRL